MAYFHSDPARESDPTAQPDIEVFYRTETANRVDRLTDDDGDPLPAGWFWWSCFPGCLPDSDPFGPFASQQEALADARKF